MRIQPVLSAVALLVLALAAASPALAQVSPSGSDAPFTQEFFIENCDFASSGSNPFFILEPGYRTIFEGEEDGENVVLVITVLDATQQIGDVVTRVVVERESADGEIVEVSRNFFAICEQTNSVFYFGEDVDNYEDGKIDNHDGSWRAGVNGARPGIIMPGTILLGARYFQEIAPGVALDKAEIMTLDAVVETPLAQFQHALKTRETTPLEPGNVEFKYYAPGIGLIRDGPLRLVRAFFTS
jgi:hypothetical protein